MHTGNTGGGHYVSICSTKINDEDTFLLYNDENISKPENFLQNNRDAYMLVYNVS
jgi:uncharacterized UBP type Zn finger protein